MGKHTGRAKLAAAALYLAIIGSFALSNVISAGAALVLPSPHKTVIAEDPYIEPLKTGKTGCGWGSACQCWKYGGCECDPCTCGLF